MLPNGFMFLKMKGCNQLCFNSSFFFDDSYRPVPLSMELIGVKSKEDEEKEKERKKKGKPLNKYALISERINHLTFERFYKIVCTEKKQLMIFVHSRNETYKTCLDIIQRYSNLKDLDPLNSEGDNETFSFQVSKSKNREVKELFPYGLSIHHGKQIKVTVAGMLKMDRNLVERMFEAGVIKCLVCTATLAWGVNLPAYTVLIKGTTVYDAERGGFVDLSVLDVLQIFGRAGRPQYEDFGKGIIITEHDRLFHCIS